jgi:signal transduction histidine kinase
MTLAVLVGSVGATLVTAIVMVRRTAPVYRVVRRSFDDPRGSVPPPSLALLREAFATPKQLATSALGAQVIAVLVGVAGLLPGGASPGPVHAAIALWLLGLGTASIGIAISLWGRALRPWLSRLSAEDLALARPPRVADRVGLLMVLVPVSVGSMVLGLVLADAESWSGLWVGALVAGALWVGFVALIAYRLGTRLGRAADRDQIELVRRMTAEGDPRLSSGLELSQFEQLATALEGLAEGVDVDAGVETQATLSVMELQRSKMNFMASMSHDLRSPLNSIIGFSDLLTAGIEGELNEAQLESLRMISRSGAELLNLLNEILDLARLEAGRLPIHREWTPLVEILTEALRRGSELVGDKKLGIEAELQPGLPPVHVDAERIVQSVTGLFRHAARAMERGDIRLFAYTKSDPGQDGGRACVDVVDAGAGIREVDRERIFEAFRQVAEPSGRRIGGLGLSLSLARSLVELHGGRLSFESEEGVGSTFRISLPLTAAVESDA